jgi:uncharacterized protein (TIGR02147 family)
MTTENLTLLILNAQSSKEALQQVFAWRKALDSRFSLAYIAHRLGLKSRGTLSLMLRSERPIPSRIRRPLFQVLTRDEPLTDYLELMLARDEATSDTARQEAEAKMKALHFFLRDRFTSIHLQHGLNLLASDLLCAFDLFQGRPTERQLIEFFGRARFPEVQTAIGSLLLNGLIEKQEGHLKRTDKTQRFLTIQGQEQDSMLRYLKESIHDAWLNVGKWQGDTSMSCFGSTTMSVRRDIYVEVIKRLKKDMFRYFSELETDEGDTLIRFNMQIFPLQPPG